MPHNTLSTPLEVRFQPLKETQIPEFVEVVRGSYPLFVTDKAKSIERFQEVVRAGHPLLLAALDPSNRVVGTYAFHTFVATILGRGLPAAGLGLVGTALDKKKQRVALQIVKDFVRRTRKLKRPLSLLYPFRHDFYADMGWGAICEMKRYSVHPSALPHYPERREVRPGGDVDWTVLDRIHREAVGRSGALGLSRPAPRWAGMLKMAEHIYTAGPASRPEGYILFRFVRVPGDPDEFHHDLEVQEMEWTTSRAMRAILGFLSAQRDQAHEVHLLWPREGNLDAILREPVRRGAPHIQGLLGHGPVVGHGVMLRLEDPEEAFEIRPYRGARALSLEVQTRDPLAGRNIRFRSIIRGDEASGVRPRRASLSADLPTLSRLWAGALGFQEAVDFALAEISPASAVEDLETLFQAPQPWVVERF